LDVTLLTRPARRARDFGLACFALVALGLYLVFFLLPLVMSVRSSLTNKNPLRLQDKYVGLANYREMLHDQQLHRSLIFTVVLAVAVTVVANLLGLAFAVLLNRTSLSYRIMRTIAFLPQVISGVIVGFIWQTILTENGLLNALLEQLGLISSPIGWLGSPFMASLSIGIVVSWVLSGFTTVVYLAALQGVPPELYDAANVDGAGALSRFRHVTVPMIAPGTTISVTISLITVLKLYDIVTVLTGGGPANSTQSTAMYVVQEAFTANRFGYSSAVAVLLLVVSAAIALSVTGLLRRREVSL
jgi:ABC-type sugar transport system permease subunit